MVIGHQSILDFLKKCLVNQCLSHAYLFTGPAHLGKKTVALEFIKMLNGREIEQVIHPDILIIEPEVVEKAGIKKESEISIKEARKIQHQLSLFPYRASYKVALIDRAEQLTIEASNCLLKTLEEPSGQAILILVTAKPQALLPTIISRCQVIKFLPVPREEIEKGINSGTVPMVAVQPEGQSLEKIIRLANGRPGLVIQYLKNPELIEEQNKIIKQLEKLLKSDLSERYQYAEEMSKNIPSARRIINYWLFWFRDLLLLGIGCSNLVLYLETSQYKSSYSLAKLKNIIQAIKKTDWLLSNPSINARLILEVLMLEL